MSVSLMMMMMVVMISLARGQVNREIDQFEDLLAVDSFDNEVKFFLNWIFHEETFLYFKVFVVRPPPRKVKLPIM